MIGASEGSRTYRRLPGSLVQIRIIWKYELLRYLRSKRLLASVLIAVAVLGLTYALPLALGESYHGTETNISVTVIDVGSLGIPPWELPYNSVGTLDDEGIDRGSLKLYVNGTEYPSGSTSWSIAGADDRVPEQVSDSPTIIMFTGNVSGRLVTASYTWAMSEQDFDMKFINFASLLIIVSAALFGADALSGEYQNRTGYLILPNPLKREALFFGKFASCMTMGLVMLGLLYAGVALLSVMTVDGIDDDLATSFALAVEFLLAAMAVAFLVSSIMNGTTGATVFTLLLFVMVMPAIDGVSSLTGQRIEASLTYAASTVIYILVDPYIENSADSLGNYPDPHTAVIVMFAYALVAILIGLRLFKRRQLAD